MSQQVVAYTDYFVPSYDRLPYKYGKSSAAWSQYVNSHYSPAEGSWTVIDNKWSYKCLSYAASTVLDWFILRY